MATAADQLTRSRLWLAAAFGLRTRAERAVRARAALPRPPAFVVVVVTVVVLNLVGLVMILSASSVAALSRYGSSWYFFDRQLAWALVGAGVFWLASRIDYRAWRRWALPLLGVSTALLAVVLLPGVGIRVDGARRWLGAGVLRFQPTEVAKLGLLLFTADLLARRARRVRDARAVVLPVLLVTAGIGGLVLLEPDLDSTIVLGLIVGSVLAVGGVPWRQLATVGVAGGLASVYLAFAAPYRRARVLAFLDPWSDPSNTGYQIKQSLLAIGSGGWGGVGLGAGRAKWLFLPNAHTDFIFAIVGEELGLLGCLLVVLLFVCFGVAGMCIALRAPDRFGMLLAVGVTSWVVGQAAINIGAVTGLLPVSGIPLPFLSSGGSALVVTMAAAGLLANVARQGSWRVPAPERPARARVSGTR